MKKFISAILIFLSYSSNLAGQCIWNPAGIRINFCDPDSIVVSPSSKVHRNSEVSITVSNNDEILFYTNGVSVWNKNDEVMENGDEMGGHRTSSQAAVIQYSSNSQKYHLFTIGQGIGENGILYLSTIDMLLDNELGAVTKKKVPIDNNFTENIVAIPGKCDTTWLLLHKRDTSLYISIPVIGDMVGSPQIASDAGSVSKLVDVDPFSEKKWNGDLIISPNNNIGVNTSFQGVVEIFKFNNSTGIIEDIQILQSKTYNREYIGGRSGDFSQSGNLFYLSEYFVTLENVVAQYDLTYNTIEEIRSSRIEIDRRIPNRFLSMDIRRDVIGRMWVSGLDSFHISVINKPENSGHNCDFVYNYLKVSDHLYYFQSLNESPVLKDERVPNLSQPFPKDTLTCDNNIVLSAWQPNVQYLWQDGSNDSTYSVTAPGIYWVERNVDDCVIRRDSINVNFNPGTTSFSQRTLCEGEVFQWNDKMINSTGYYYDTIPQVGNCDLLFELDITFDLHPSTSKNFSICEGDTLTLSGQDYTEEGIYEDTTTSTTGGCDTLVLVDVVVESTPQSDTIFAELRSGGGIQLYGQHLHLSWFLHT